MMMVMVTMIMVIARVDEDTRPATVTGETISQQLMCSQLLCTMKKKGHVSVLHVPEAVIFLTTGTTEKGQTSPENRKVTANGKSV